MLKRVSCGDHKLFSFICYLSTAALLLHLAKAFCLLCCVNSYFKVRYRFKIPSKKFVFIFPLEHLGKSILFFLLSRNLCYDSPFVQYSSFLIFYCYYYY